MVEPVTIGSLVVGALVLAAEAVVKTSVGEAVKDAYSALKARISQSPAEKELSDFSWL